MSKRRAVITGVGPITAVGRGREDFWRGIRAEKSGIAEISFFDTSAFNAHCGGEIRDWVPKIFFRHIDSSDSIVTHSLPSLPRSWRLTMPGSNIRAKNRNIASALVSEPRSAAYPTLKINMRIS